jgi:hypothetical protein
MKKWGAHEGLWSLKMNGKKSKSKYLYIILFFPITSAQPSVDQSLSGEKQTKNY